MRKLMRSVVGAFLIGLILTGCVTQMEKENRKNLDFTVVKKEDIPQELAEEIEKKKNDPFQMTYADQGYLYIAEGYGQQNGSGYSVEVKTCCESKTSVIAATNLIGPDSPSETGTVETYPYVVIKLEDTEKQVLFE